LVGVMMLSSSRVTAAVLASMRPVMVPRCWTVIESRAMTVPWKVVRVSSTAELPTCQKTLHALAMPVSKMVVPTAVFSAEPTWKMNTALGSPCASRVSAPLTSSVLVALYTPGVSVWPAPMAAKLGAVGVCAAASL
jgi:hypothetical protein